MMPLTDGNPDTAARTLWMGDLAYWMDENYVFSLFAHTGGLMHVKIIRSKMSGVSEGYGFLEFQTREAAEAILHSFNGQPIPNTDQIFRLNWAAFGVGKTTEADYSVFVGDLAPDVTDFILQEFFRQFYPTVRSAKVITDPVSGRSKGYGFVRFGVESERDRALNDMNGQFISTRPIRVSLATAKKAQTGTPAPSQPSSSTTPQTAEMDPNNTTLFIGGLSASVQEDQLRSIFGHFGDIIYTKIPPGKGCGFVQFVERKHAEKAMAHLNGTVIGNSAVRISWGKSTGKGGAAAAAAASSSTAASGSAAGYGSAYPSAYPTSSYGYDASTGAYAGYGGYNDPYSMYQQYPQAYTGYGAPPPPTGTAHPEMGATSTAQGSLVSVYDPLAPVNVDKLNAAYVHRHQSLLTGRFLRPAVVQ